ncbi:hypothetical protein D3C74_207500 [compost metagenome]
MNVSGQPLNSSGKKTSKENRQRYYEREMTEIFESHELTLYDKLNQVDWVLYRISCEASAMGIPSEYRASYVLPKVKDMVEQIAEERERGTKV